MISPQKKLAIFLPTLSGGGAQRVTLNLAQGIAEQGFTVDLILASAKGSYLAQVPKSVRLVDLKSSRVLASLPALVRYLRRERPEAMLSAMNYINITALWARRLAHVSTRVVVSEHSVPSYSARHTSSWRDRLIPRLSVCYRWADSIVAVSQGVKSDLSQMTGIPYERILVIYNPVVTPELKQKVQAPLNHPWFCRDQPPVLLAVGRLTESKDFPTLIQSFARVRQNRPARLIILGEGSERPNLETLSKQLGLEEDVSLPGFVENPYSFMAQASLFVLSSKYEALSTVFI